jgi:hypothetical protein
MSFTVSTVGGSVTVTGLTAVKALETAASLARAGSNVFIAEYTEGGSFHKAMTFYTEES